jgi:hypothetical protein
MTIKSLARDVVLIWLGSLGLYVAMAACSSTSKERSPAATQDAGTDAAVVADGSTGTGGASTLDASGDQGTDGASATPDAGTKDAAGLVDAVADAVTTLVDAAPDAVSDAAAQETSTVTSRCNVKGSDGYYYAEASFPGKTVAELAAVHFYYEAPDAELDGYTHRTGVMNMLLKPGSVALLCSTQANSDLSIIFVLP